MVWITPIFVGVFFTFCVPCCDVRYNFHIKMMFDFSLHVRSCLQQSSCFIVLFFVCLHLMYTMLLVSLDCPFDCPFCIFNVYWINRRLIDSQVSRSCSTSCVHCVTLVTNQAINHVYHVVKNVLRGHLWDKEKCSFNKGVLLKGFNSCEIFNDWTRKM